MIAFWSILHSPHFYKKKISEIRSRHTEFPIFNAVTPFVTTLRTRKPAPPAFLPRSQRRAFFHVFNLFFFLRSIFVLDSLYTYRRSQTKFSSCHCRSYGAVQSLNFAIWCLSAQVRISEVCGDKMRRSENSLLQTHTTIPIVRRNTCLVMRYDVRDGWVDRVFLLACVFVVGCSRGSPSLQK